MLGLLAKMLGKVLLGYSIAVNGSKVTDFVLEKDFQTRQTNHTVELVIIISSHSLTSFLTCFMACLEYSDTLKVLGVW